MNICEARFAFVTHLFHPETFSYIHIDIHRRIEQYGIYDGIGMLVYGDTACYDDVDVVLR